MTTREDLRRDGAEMRARLFGAELPDPAGAIVPDLDDLVAEVTFGAVWSRPGLALPDRMIATLAALCAVQRLNHLHRYVGAALDLGLDPIAIVEVLVQCGIYAGFTASEEAIGVAGMVFAERGISLPDEAAAPASLEELTAQGRELLEALHGSRG